MNMINKEPERHEIEALLPWHAAGTLNRRDADRVEHPDVLREITLEGEDPDLHLAASASPAGWRM